MLNIKKLDHVSNQHIYDTTKEPPLYEIIKQRQLQFIGHILRMEKDEISYTYALYEPTIGKSKKGAPKTNYRKYVANMIDGTKELTAQEI